jgi:integrase
MEETNEKGLVLSYCGRTVACSEYKRIYRQKTGKVKGITLRIRQPPSQVQTERVITAFRADGRRRGMNSLAEALYQVKQQQQHNITSIRALIAGKYPDTLCALKIFDMESTQAKRGKGFNLIKRENKKHGFLYYVRFSHAGKMLPNSWNTHTNNREEAEKFARENKIRLVERYLKAHDSQMYPTIENYFSGATNSSLSERCRKEYRAAIVNKFIPFLKNEKITSFDEITAQTLWKYQDFLTAGGMRPQTVNNNLKPVKQILAHLARKGAIPENPANHIRGVQVREKDKKARGCYELEKLSGVFNKRWKDRLSFLLCLLVYTTGMRNSEIKRIRKEDVVSIDGCRFIRITESKTPNGMRLVPLHEIVYRKLAAWAFRNDKEQGLLCFRGAAPFTRANTCLGRQLGIGEEELEAENITFYSGRHFWKTLMNSEGLGEDIEEVFMGHKVSSSVAKLYNHRDKQGKKLMVKKAKQVFSILDHRIFMVKP